MIETKESRLLSEEELELVSGGFEYYNNPIPYAEEPNPNPDIDSSGPGYNPPNPLSSQ